MAVIVEWFPVVSPVFFGITSILSALWPDHAMRFIRKICEWQMKLLGLRATITLTEGAVRSCRIFNLCMIPVNGVFLWIGLQLR